MILFYFKSAISSLRNNFRFSLINITGFAFAISVCLAITLFLLHEFSYDKYNMHADRIIRLTNTDDNSGMIDYRVKDILLENYPQIENGCIVWRAGYPWAVSVNNVGLSLDGIMSVDNQFFEIFTVEFISGEQNQPLIDNNSAVLTESAAEILFGEEDPMGQEILLENKFSLTVTGIIKDFPTTSSISAGLLVNAENDDFKFSISMSNSSDLSTYRWPFQIYLKLSEHTNPNHLIDQINSGIDLLNPYVDHLSFIKLKDIYLHDMTAKSQNKQGNYKLLLLMASIALIILILAIINYINLTVSQHIKRSKETGIRKTLGANRINLIYHFLFESVFVTSIAFFAGTLLLLLKLPLYNSIFNLILDPAILIRLPAILMLPGAILILGVIIGCGPAIILAGISPLWAIRGLLTNTGKRSSSRIILTVFQFSVSIVLISSVIIINKQVRFVKHNNPGFNAEYLLRLDIPGSEDIGSQVIYDLLARSSLVNQIAGTNGVPGDINLWMSPNMEDSDNNGVPCLLVDTAFLKVFGLNIIRGRDIEPGDYGKVCMINEAAWKHFGFTDFENKRFNNYDNDGFEIIGVVNDFHFSSLHSRIDPLFLLITPESGFSQLNIRFDGINIVPLMAYIRQIWSEVLPGHPINYEFYDEWFASMYRAEERFTQTIGLFALLAVVISCIGILGMAVFSSERRTKEIGIRKVNGAKISEVLVMLNKGFVKWVVIAFIIATPIAYYTMNRWLQNFAYRTELSWWIFVLAGVITLGIALLTVSWQSWRAARRNPVEALRYE